MKERKNTKEGIVQQMDDCDVVWKAVWNIYYIIVIFIYKLWNSVAILDITILNKFKHTFLFVSSRV